MGVRGLTLMADQEIEEEDVISLIHSQICGKLGHSTLQCYHRPDEKLQ